MYAGHGCQCLCEYCARMDALFVGRIVEISYNSTEYHLLYARAEYELSKFDD